jgi:bacillopeptidase F (M6 metalloprotease family)
LVVATIGLIYWYALRWRLRKYFINKTFYKSQLANKQITLTALDDGIYLDNKLQFGYDSIKKTALLEDAVVIYHSIGTFYIPNSAFENQKEKIAFIDLLKA